MKKLTNLLMAATILDFSIIDLPLKTKQIKFEAHYSNGKTCTLILDKREFYGKWAKEDQAFFDFIQKSCEAVGSSD